MNCSIVFCSIDWRMDCANDPDVIVHMEPVFSAPWEIASECDDSILVYRYNDITEDEIEKLCVEYRSIRKGNSDDWLFKGALGGEFILSDGRVINSDNVWSSRASVFNKILDSKWIDVRDSGASSYYALDLDRCDLGREGKDFFLVRKAGEVDVQYVVSKKPNSITKGE